MRCRLHPMICELNIHLLSKVHRDRATHTHTDWLTYQPDILPAISMCGLNCFDTIDHFGYDKHRQNAFSAPQKLNIPASHTPNWLAYRFLIVWFDNWDSDGKLKFRNQPQMFICIGLLFGDAQSAQVRTIRCTCISIIQGILLKLTKYSDTNSTQFLRRMRLLTLNLTLWFNI